MPAGRHRRRSAADANSPRLSVFSAVQNADMTAIPTGPWWDPYNGTNPGSMRNVRSIADVPATLNGCFSSVRHYSTPGPTGPPNSFIMTVVGLRHSFYDHRFEFSGAEEWLKQKDRKKFLDAYRHDAWLEWLRLDNVICLWRKGGRPLRVPPERCRYRDNLGIELLEYEHRMTHEEIDALPSLTGPQKALLKSDSWLKLSKADDSIFGFEVLKRSPLGDGLAWPQLQSSFIAAGTQESLQVGDAQLAYAMRRVYEQHKAGHETRYGPNSGGSQNFLKQPMKEAIVKGIKGKKGLVELVTRHDHSIEWPRPDPKHFAANRYEASKAALVDWSTPLGHMLFAKTLNPYLLQFLRQIALKERELFGAHIEAVAQRALGAPATASAKWGTKCFTDSRLAFDMVKNGLATGPISQETYAEDTDQNSELERKRKEKEAELPKSQTQPLVVAQGAAVTNRAGRKTGSNDRKNQ